MPLCWCKSHDHSVCADSRAAEIHMCDYYIYQANSEPPLRKNNRWMDELSLCVWLNSKTTETTHCSVVDCCRMD